MTQSPETAAVSARSLDAIENGAKISLAAGVHSGGVRVAMKGAERNPDKEQRSLEDCASEGKTLQSPRGRDVRKWHTCVRGAHEATQTQGSARSQVSIHSWPPGWDAASERSALGCDGGDTLAGRAPSFFGGKHRSVFRRAHLDESVRLPRVSQLRDRDRIPCCIVKCLSFHSPI